MCYHVDLDLFASQSSSALVLNILHSLEMVGRTEDIAKRIWDAKAVVDVCVPLSKEKKGKKKVEEPVPHPPNWNTTTLSKKDRTASSKKDEITSSKKDKAAFSKKDKASSKKKDQAASRKTKESSNLEFAKSDPTDLSSDTSSDSGSMKWESAQFSKKKSK